MRKLASNTVDLLIALLGVVGVIVAAWVTAWYAYLTAKEENESLDKTILAEAKEDTKDGDE